MFISAIERAGAFTRAIHTVSRAWGSQAPIPGAATLFFVNADGWALTCGHVANALIAADQLSKKYALFKAERARVQTVRSSRTALQALERKHGYTRGAIFDLKHRLVNCVEGDLHLEIRLHQNVDVALLKFSGFSRLGVTAFPTFARDGAALKQGKFLCRLGFPFPEFTNFGYNTVADALEWTETGRVETPQFPIEGMVTRHLAGTDVTTLTGFEMSTPGLKGQSGGPAFDSDGRVWGMQSATTHLDLDFDVDLEVQRAGQKRRVQESAVLHVGRCIHVNVLKAFMQSHGVAFTEG